MDRMTLAGMIDQTLLAPSVSTSHMRDWLVAQTAQPWASVCVPPAHVGLACEVMEPAGIPVCTVVGFPLGYDTTEAKAVEAGQLVGMGAREIDMVCRIGALAAGEEEVVAQDIHQVVRAVKSFGGRSALVKVILETGFLDGEAIRLGCRIAESAGAAFVKTSTGFGPRGASVDDVRLMRETVGDRLGVKAAGGIRTLDDALAMVGAGASRLGTSAGLELLSALSPE
jgi:deoxyribose-phosphate aldolase